LVLPGHLQENANFENEFVCENKCKCENGDDIVIVHTQSIAA